MVITHHSGATIGKHPLPLAQTNWAKWRFNVCPSLTCHCQLSGLFPNVFKVWPFLGPNNKRQIMDQAPNFSSPLSSFIFLPLFCTIKRRIQWIRTIGEGQNLWSFLTYSKPVSTPKSGLKCLEQAPKSLIWLCCWCCYWMVESTPHLLTPGLGFRTSPPQGQIPSLK